MQRISNIFSQLLQLFPRLEFQSAVTATKAEHHMRGFACRGGEFVRMLFCQLDTGCHLRVKRHSEIRTHFYRQYFVRRRNFFF